MIWTQTRNGRAFDLVYPDPAQVDFTEIAWTLAHLPRYAANFEKPITVGQHTLIVMAASAPDDHAHALLHDAHEAYMGDITTPCAQALAYIAADLVGEPPHKAQAANLVASSIAGLKSLLEGAIYAAAGLRRPTPETRARIHKADLIALQTERRDFLARSPRPWAPEIEAEKPLRTVYRLRPAADVAEELVKHFKTYIPALRKRAA